MTASTLTRLAPTQVALDIPIADEELSAAEERAFRKLVKHARLPGFRKGKVPRKVFEQAYGTETITSEAVDEVLPAAYAKAVREHDLDPVERPRIEVVEEDGGRPRRLRATVEVRPQIELRDYRGIEIERAPVVVTDDDVEHSLGALARERATAIPVARPAALGDLVTIDYEGTIDGQPFKGGSAQGQTTELDEGRFVPGFVAGIAGMGAGETKDVEARFPERYPAAELAGRTASFRVTLHEVKELEVPPLDDDFAKAISRHETLAQLRDDVKNRLESIARSRERRAIAGEILDRLLASAQFELPATLVDAELERIVMQARAEQGERGESADEERENELRQASRGEAESRVRATLLVEWIAKREQIEATPADVQSELEALARQYGQPVGRIRQLLGRDVLSVVDGIVRNKTLDFLVDNARITTGQETPGASS